MSSVIFNKIWSKYDANKDGKIDKDEFRNACYDLGHFLTEDELSVAFTLLDGDGSGQIEKEEFAAFWRTDDRFTKVRLDEDQTAKLEQMAAYFRFYDKDGSGALCVAKLGKHGVIELTPKPNRDENEFKKMTDHMTKSGYNLKHLNFSFKALDRDGDGRITFNEYLAKMIDLGVLDQADGTRPVHG